MLKNLTFSVLVAASLAGLTACTSQIETNTSETDLLPGTGITVRPAYSGWVEALFLDEITKVALEQLGYEVEEPAAASYNAIFPAIANGELDYTPEYIYYNHAAFFEKAGGDEKLEVVGEIMPNTKSYEIDRQTSEEYNITNLEQLRDPEIAALFDSDGDGKANLVGCNPGWGCELSIEHHLDVYKLRDTVEQVQGEYNLLMADAITRYRQGEPIFYWTSSATFVPAVLKVDEDVVQLEVPFTSLPGEDQSKMTEKETTLNGDNIGFPIDRMMFLANDQFLSENPTVKRLFENIQIPLEDFSVEMLRVQEGESKPDEIRAHAGEWIQQNQALFDSWVEAARSDLD